MSKQDSTTIEHISRTIELLQGKWTVHILWAMRTVPVRLSTLKRLYPTASKKALRAGLRDLEEAHIVVRHDLTNILLHVEYRMAKEWKDTICGLLVGMDALGQMIETKKLRNADARTNANDRQIVLRNP